MRAFSILDLLGGFIFLFASVSASAAVGDINCVAKIYEIKQNVTTIKATEPLVLTQKMGSSVHYEVEVVGRHFSLNGDIVSGDFLLTQALAPDYTTGINSSAAFNSSGRLTLSQVIGAEVFKLECVKTLASDFPQE